MGIECVASTAIGSSTTLLENCNTETALLGMGFAGLALAGCIIYGVWKTNAELEARKNGY